MSEDSRWQAGWRAGAKRKPVTACPYPPTSSYRRDWIEGYRIATEPMNPRGDAA